LCYIQKVFKTTTELCKEHDFSKGEDALGPFVQTICLKIQNLKLNEMLLLPGGWRTGRGGHAIMYIIECTAVETAELSSDDLMNGKRFYRFSVCNTGQGLHYHPSSGHAHPKIKFKTTLCLNNIPGERILDEVFLGALFHLMFTAAPTHKPSKLYELLIPALAGKPLEACLADCYEDEAVEWRSPQRAGSCYVRCVLESFHHLMRRKGLSLEQTKLVSFALRYQLVLMLEHDLKAVKHLRSSNVRLIRMSCQQLAYCAVKQSRVRQLSVEQLAAVQRCVDNI